MQNRENNYANERDSDADKQECSIGGIERRLIVIVVTLAALTLALVLVALATPT